MPLDGIKSMVYRSFVTCDDPEGVVDCSTIKISKIRSMKMDQKTQTHQKSRNSNKSLSLKAEKQEMRERSQSQSSLQFMEVYREAEKLNQIIESWSKGLRSDRKSEVGLRESLLLLRKLQEASNQLVLKKEKDQRTFSHEFRDQSLSEMEFQRCSRIGADEIKEVIKGSLLRPNMTNAAAVKKTSSGESSQVNSYQNSKGTNLIAKLMGLEETSSRDSRTIHIAEKKESESVIKKKGPEKRILREILETMDSKGFEHHSHCFEQRLKDVQPIVLIRPINLLKQRSKEEAFERNLLVREVKMKDLRQFDDFDFHGGILSSKKLQLKQITQNERAKKKAAEKLRSTSSSVDKLPQEKEPIDKKVLTIKKVRAANKRPSEKKIAKAKTAASTDSRNCQKKEKAVHARKVTKSQSSIVEDRKEEERVDKRNSDLFEGCKSKLKMEVCTENRFKETLYTMMERDLSCRKTMNRTWDSGWENGFSGEKVVNDIEKLILSGLVEEFFT